MEEGCDGVWHLPMVFGIDLRAEAFYTIGHFGPGHTGILRGLLLSILGNMLMFVYDSVYTFVFGIKYFAFLFLIETRHHVIDVSSTAVPDFLNSLGRIQWLVRIHGEGHPGYSAQAYAD